SREPRGGRSFYYHFDRFFEIATTRTQPADSLSGIHCSAGGRVDLTQTLHADRMCARRFGALIVFLSGDGSGSVSFHLLYRLELEERPGGVQRCPILRVGRVVSRDIEYTACHFE
ncbi:hypothetical protein PMAYCL1PPCAC_03267, partial [Pristionchus mayeri]